MVDQLPVESSSFETVICICRSVEFPTDRLFEGILRLAPVPFSCCKCFGSAPVKSKWICSNSRIVVGLDLDLGALNWCLEKNISRVGADGYSRISLFHGNGLQPLEAKLVNFEPQELISKITLQEGKDGSETCALESTVQCCDDLVEDLVHVEPEIVEDQNDVDLPTNDLNQSFASKWPLEPCLDMVFDDSEDAHACYNAYARRKGFSIRINHKRLSKKDKSLVGVEYGCWREGFCHKSYEDKERKGPKPAKTRMGCKAMMSLKKKEEAWIVTKFVDDHNHELLTPKSTSLLRGHRVISRAQKNLIDTLNESGVPTRKIMSVLSKESGGDYNVGCVALDIQNYLCNKRRILLQDGDAQRMYSHFTECQLKN
ncbi:hypothetical protein CMV_024548 [Castanea mollissima]|uniref:FAR1 domain-containing protein n=1 Tax=Castanea mollissima TaxID=60419 RepID=A0A8J4QAH2_9ROSI|nr:hypothetical protein CMV_024548 [Castanea mollissima]